MTTYPVTYFKTTGDSSFIQRTPRPAQLHWRRRDSERINRMDDRELFERIAVAMRRSGGGA